MSRGPPKISNSRGGGKGGGVLKFRTPKHVFLGRRRVESRGAGSVLTPEVQHFTAGPSEPSGPEVGDGGLLGRGRAFLRDSKQNSTPLLRILKCLFFFFFSGILLNPHFTPPEKSALATGPKSLTLAKGPTPNHPLRGAKVTLVDFLSKGPNRPSFAVRRSC